MRFAWLFNKGLLKPALLLPLAFFIFATPARGVELAQTRPPIIDFDDTFSQGTGFNYHQPDGSFVDFRLADFSPAAPLSLGSLNIFLEDGATVAYTTSPDRIKEEIFLYEKPASNVFSFNFDKGDLSVVQDDDGYRLVDIDGIEKFFIPNPTVADANGNSGFASLQLSDNAAVLTVDQEFIDEAAYPIVIDPTVVGSVNWNGTLQSSQRKTFFDGSRYWAFYQEGYGSQVYYVSSTDSVNWSAPVIFPGVEWSQYATDCSVFSDGNEVYVAFIKDGLNVRKGTINGSSIAWGSNSVVFTANSNHSYAFPVISKDSNGKLWVLSRHSANVGGTWNITVNARRSLNPNDPSIWEPASYDLSDTTEVTPDIYPTILPLSDGQVYALWSRATSLKGSLFDGSAWGPTVLIGNRSGRQPISTVVDSTGTIYVAYSHITWLEYRAGTAPYGQTNWTSGIRLSQEANAGISGSLSLDRSTDQVYAFYLEDAGGVNSAARRIRFKRVQDSGSKILTGASENNYANVTAYSSEYDTSTNVTVQAGNTATADVKNANSGKLLARPGDVVYVAGPARFDSAMYKGTGASGLTLTSAYWSGSTWAPLAVTDRTNNLSRSGDSLYFVPPGDWQTKDDGLYWLAFGTSTTPTAAPVGSMITAFKRYDYMSSSYAEDGKAFALFTEGFHNPVDVEFANTDIAAPNSSIAEPQDSAVVSGETAIVSGTATDNVAVAAVDVAIRRNNDNYYWDSQNTTFTAAPTWNPATITSGASSSLAEWGFDWDLPQNTEETFTIEARATDADGNVESSPSSVTVLVDNLPLTGSISLNGGAFYTSESTLAVASDVPGAALMRFSADSTSWTEWASYAATTTISLSPGDGTRTVEGQFKKSAGGSAFTTSDTVILDTEAPVTGITSPANNNMVEGTVTINAIGDDALSGIQKVGFYVNDQLIAEDTQAPYQTEWNSFEEINGPSILSVVAVDNLGNTSGGQPVQVEVINPLPFTEAGTIKDWLAVGPFFSLDPSATLENDYLGGENTIKPSENSTASADTTWTALSTTADAVDISAFFPAEATESVAYANVYINSPVSHTAQLRLGSDDAVKAWVNGEAVLENNVVRSFSLDEDTAAISLNQGWNQLLVKVADTATETTGRAFSAKIADFSGGEIAGLTYQLDNPFGEIFFEDNFNQESTTPSSKWISEGVNQVEYNVLRTEGSMLTAEDMPQAHYAVSFELSLSSWSTGTQAQAYLFRAQDQANGYVFKVNQGYEITGAFYRRVAGIDTQIGDPVMLPLEGERPGQIRIEAKGAAFKLFLDNALYLDVLDPANAWPEPGKVGAVQDAGNVAFIDNFKVVSQSANYWTIKGRVSDSSNWSLAGLTVIATPIPTTDTEIADTDEYIATTNANGYYTIAVPQSPSSQLLLLQVDHDYYSAQETSLTLSAEAPQATQDFVLANPATVYGQVTDSTGSPIAGALIGAYRLDGASGQAQGESDIFGNFSLYDLDAPGAYGLLIDAQGYSSTITPEIELNAGETTSLPTIELSLAGKISGTVVDTYGNPVAGVYIAAKLPEAENASKGTTTAADGSYLIEDIDAPNAYEVEALSEDYELDIKENIQVQPGQTTQGVDFVLGLRPAWGAPTGVESASCWADSRVSLNIPADTHQWITWRAIEILRNDADKIGLNPYARLVTYDQELGEPLHPLWYWIARGTTRADTDITQGWEGHSKAHLHDPDTHMGWFLGSFSAADSAEEAFNDAIDAWMAGYRQRSMYLLGLALHHVQDLRNPQHTLAGAASHFPALDYEEYVRDNKENMSVASDGIYQGSFNRFRGGPYKSILHQPNNTAYGWVDRSAHVSQRSLYLVELFQYERTDSLVQSAQQFSAGFIKFFFDEVDYRENKPAAYPSINVALSFGQNEEMELHLIKPGYDRGDGYGDMYIYNYLFWLWNRPPRPGAPIPPLQDWGIAGAALDNPNISYTDAFDEDPQWINIIRPADDGKYKVIVDFDTPGEAFVSVWVDGRLVGSYRSGEQPDDTEWQPVEIEMPSGRVIFGNRFF